MLYIFEMGDPTISQSDHQHYYIIIITIIIIIIVLVCEPS